MAEKLEQEYAEKCRILIEIMVFLKTERLVLRNLMPQDADVMFDYRNNEICSRYQKGQTKDYAEIAKMIERRRADVLSAEAPFMVAVALKETDEMIGEIVVLNQRRTRLNSGIRFPIDITGVDMRLRHSRRLSTSSIEWHLIERLSAL